MIDNNYSAEFSTSYIKEKCMEFIKNVNTKFKKEKQKHGKIIYDKYNKGIFSRLKLYFSNYNRNHESIITYADCPYCYYMKFKEIFFPYKYNELLFIENDVDMRTFINIEYMYKNKVEILLLTCENMILNGNGHITLNENMINILIQ